MKEIRILRLDSEKSVVFFPAEFLGGIFSSRIIVVDEQPLNTFSVLFNIDGLGKLPSYTFFDEYISKNRCHFKRLSGLFNEKDYTIVDKTILKVSDEYYNHLINYTTTKV